MVKMSKNKAYKALLGVVAALLFAVPSVRAQSEAALLVDVPVPPEQITRLDERCNYIVDNFWKRLNFKGAFSSVDRMEATLAQFLSVTPYATADTVYQAIDFLIRGVEKADAKNLVTLAGMAERLCGTDSAEYASEDLMLPFALAVAESKKIKGEPKEYYSRMARRMANSRIGAKPADFAFTMPDGTTGHFSEITEPTVLIFFYDPTDFNSRLARTRLSTDFVVKTLVNRKLLSVLAIYPGEPNEAWHEDMDSMPPLWIVGAAPGIEEYFSIKRSPQMYFLDEDREITDKDFGVDAAILYFSQFIKR